MGFEGEQVETDQLGETHGSTWAGKECTGWIGLCRPVYEWVSSQNSDIIRAVRLEWDLVERTQINREWNSWGKRRGCTPSHYKGRRKKSRRASWVPYLEDKVPTSPYLIGHWKALVSFQQYIHSLQRIQYIYSCWAQNLRETWATMDN